MRKPTPIFGLSRAMTLVELLVVIGIIAILSVKTAPAFFSAKRSMALTLNAGHVIDSLASARQMAITKNRPIEVRIYLGAENQSAEDRMILFQRKDSGEGYEAISNILKIDEAIGISANPTWSSILTSGTAAEEKGSKYQGRYYAFRFMADGSTDLAIGAEPPTITFVYRADLAKAALPPNFFTLQLDLQTGTIRPFRPL